MLLDGHKVEKGHTIETDVCIIGGGPAGITLAREFANKNFNVVLLESGGEKFRHPPQWLQIAYNVGRPYFDIVFTRHRMLGGSTYKWYGLCRPLDSIDFEERSWVPYSGWPINKETLDPYYDRASAYFQLPTTEFSTQNFLEPDQAEIQNNVIETKVYQFSPPTDFREQYLHETAGAGNISIIYHSNVTKLESNETGTKVIEVKVATLTGRKFQVSARVFIIACGGIENARLLLVSNSRVKPGLGNQHDLVGRFFNEHPHTFYAQILDTENNRFRGIYKSLDYKIDAKNQPPTGVFSLRQEIMRKNKLLNSCAILVNRPDYKLGTDYNSLTGVSLSRLAELFSHNSFIKATTWRDLKNIIFDPATGLRILKNQIENKISPKGSITLRFMIEAAPNPDSRVTLSEKKDFLGVNRINLDWRLSEQDLVSYINYNKVLVSELRTLGFSVNEIKFEPDETGWPYAMTAAKHHLGATRMHQEPQKGVVDSNCKVHGMENLYIAGSSVFPTSGCANPTLTIIALTLRLADHIKQTMDNMPSLTMH